MDKEEFIKEINGNLKILNENQEALTKEQKEYKKDLENKLEQLEKRIVEANITPEKERDEALSNLHKEIVGKIKEGRSAELSFEKGLKTKSGYSTGTVSGLTSVDGTILSYNDFFIAEVNQPTNILSEAQKSQNFISNTLVTFFKEDVDDSATPIGEGADFSTGGESKIKARNYSLTKFGYETEITQEALEDNILNLLQVIQDDVPVRFAIGLEKQLINGSGTGVNLKGILNYTKKTASNNFYENQAVEELTLANGNAFSYDSLVDLIAKIPVQFLPNAKFYMNRNTLAKVRKLKTTEGSPLVFGLNPVTGSHEMSILGYPVALTEYLPSFGVANAKPMVFGDLSRGAILGSKPGSGLNLILDPYTKAGSGRVKLIFSKRFSGGIYNTQSYSVLKTTAA